MVGRRNCAIEAELQSSLSLRGEEVLLLLLVLVLVLEGVVLLLLLLLLPEVELVEEEEVEELSADMVSCSIVDRMVRSKKLLRFLKISTCL